MKRSEMIKILDSEFIFPEGLADQILDVLEKHGMLPPPIPTNASGWEVGKGAPTHINQWEPEEDRYCGAV